MQLKERDSLLSEDVAISYAVECTYLFIEKNVLIFKERD